MIRTRDLVLLLVVVAFLAVVIGVTVISQLFAVPGGNPSVTTTPDPGIEPTATVLEPETLSREERLAAMREKVAEGGAFEESAPPEPSAPNDDPDPADEESPATSTETGIEREVVRCAGYVDEAQPFWSPFGIQFEQVEGALLVYREIERDIAPDPSATSSQPQPAETSREVIAQLPVRSTPMPDISCLTSDVVGIAQDGSLIRNDETALYGIFDAETRIGYALDGFPIYGSSPNPTDSCGGTMAPDGYRYQLSPERDVILNCFSAPPISL